MKLNAHVTKSWDYRNSMNKISVRHNRNVPQQLMMFSGDSWWNKKKNNTENQCFCAIQNNREEDTARVQHKHTHTPNMIQLIMLAISNSPDSIRTAKIIKIIIIIMVIDESAHWQWKIDVILFHGTILFGNTRGSLYFRSISRKFFDFN